LYTFFINDA